MHDDAGTPLLSDDPRPDGLTNAKSLLLVLTGDGKGKSSSAFGTVMRGVARDWKVCVVQFVKSGDWAVGEEAVCRRLGVEWHSLGAGFTWDSTNLDHDRALARSAWERAEGIVSSGDFDLVVLDEITYLMSWKWVETERIVDALRNRPGHVSVVCTGRDAPPELVAAADTVTSMTNVKHAYERGIAAKRGIDY